MNAVLLSGGPDSTVLTYDLARAGLSPLTITLNLGDREAPASVRHARQLAEGLGVENVLVDLSQGLRNAYAKPFPQFMRMPHTITEPVEPFGSGVALALGASLAASRGASTLYYGVHRDDTVFRDNNPEYFRLLSAAITMELGRDFSIVTPYLDLTKADVLARAVQLGVPLASTWSCGFSGEVHCGECHPCTLRQEAFASAGLDDPTMYLVGRPAPFVPVTA